MNEPAPVLYGKYQLLDLLARGGMAEVYKAKSHGVEGFEKILVIKRILPELSENPQFVEMFINEAKIAVTLSHANIVQVFDLGRAEDSYFIAMEYVAGYDLATILSRGRRLSRPIPQELAVYVVSELAKGLDYAHRRRDSQLRPLNIVHRDVSPQNVLISFEGEVKLTDFGIAKAALAVEERTDVGVLKGKYAYMSPEQARGEEVDARTDLFALGTVLYELLSGDNPFFQPESTYETLRKVREGDVPSLAEAVPELPEELAAIVGRAMSTSLDERHPNAGHLYEELVQFLYSSGRRVSGHDLADYLQELRQATEAEQAAPDDARLRAVFDQEAGTGAGYSPEATPVEVPVARTGARRSARPRRSVSGVLRPTQERRDVTALVLQSPDARFLSEPVVDRLVRRFGGLPVDYEPPPGAAATRVALFGIRDPDGRDTEHAARCAQRLVRSARSGTQTGRPGVSLQAGIHCGRMLVDVSAEPVQDEAFDALSRRARELAERAPPGQVWVSPEGHRALAGLFVTTQVGEGDAPFHVQAERSLADASGKFVGRRDELRRIGELLAAANRGKMKVIGVQGEAGGGKTRLLLETRRRLQLGGHDVGMYVASCARQNRRVPLAAIQEMLRTILGIDELEAEPEAKEKVARMRELGLSPAEIAGVSVALGLEIEEDAEGEGVESPAQLLRPALGRMALKLAEDRLTVFAWDGAENMDEESQALLDGLIRDTRDARIAVVLAYRPGFVHAWAGLPSYFELPVAPMSDEDVARLTGTRLAAEEVPLELMREVTAKSGGNPLYVEEYLKALADSGAITVRGGRVEYDPRVAEVEVPKTLRGIVSSRLSRLGPTDRHLLQIASIAAERFTAAVLAEVAGEDVEAVERALEALEKRGLVSQGPAEFDFSHDLIGEVLRDGLTLESRRELHAAVAEAVEALYPQRLDELAEKLAAHHREAGDRARAVDFMVRAADRLEGEHSLGGAVAACERAIDLLGQMAQPDRDRMIELYRRIGELSFRSRDLEGGAARLAAAVELCEALGRDADVARFSMMRGRLLVNMPGSSEEGRRWLDRAADLARRLGDQELLGDVVLATAEADIRLGEHRSAAAHFEEALGLAREAGDTEAQTRCLIPLALASASDGRVDRAIEALEEARKLSGETPDRFTECEMFKMEALVRFFANEYEASLDAGRRALELAKEYGFPYEQAVNAHNMGEAYLRMGDYKRAFASLRFSYEMSRDHGWSKLQWANMRVLGFIDATRFGSKEGRTHVIQANEFAEAHGFVWDLIQGRYYLAVIDQQRGDDEPARSGLRDILRLAAEHGHRDYVRAAEKALKALDSGSTIQLPG
ncbi:MAG TPA: protein kinase [Sandaracinaceae bacterium LLY-WYZ-13_1]|nr:protein kinase [Sandaracinaceae bacterium LLY-WYZ-13_1]